MTPSTFHPADGATIEDYLGVALPALQILKTCNAESAAAIKANLKKSFEGSAGVLETPEGCIGFERVKVKTYDPETIRSMLGEWASDVIHQDRVRIDALEKLVKRLRKGGVLDAQFARSVLGACRTEIRTEFIVRLWTEHERASYQANIAPLRPSFASRERFKGYSI